LLTTIAQRKRYLVYFFLLTLGLTVLLQLPDLLGFMHLHYTVTLALSWTVYLMPGIAALLVLWMEYGRRGPDLVIVQLRRNRGIALWYLIAFFLPVVLMVLVGGICVLPGFDIRYSWDAATTSGFLDDRWWSYPLNLVVFIPMFMGLQGYALSRLQSRHSAWLSSLIIGLFWYIWMWFAGGGWFDLSSLDQYAILTRETTRYLYVVGSLLPDLLYYFSLSIIFTWFYNSARGNLLVAPLFYAVYLAVRTGIFFLAMDAGHTGLENILSSFGNYWIILMAIVIVALFGPRNLSRQPRFTFLDTLRYSMQVKPWWEPARQKIWRALKPWWEEIKVDTREE